MVEKRNQIRMAMDMIVSLLSEYHYLSYSDIKIETEVDDSTLCHALSELENDGKISMDLERGYYVSG